MTASRDELSLWCDYHKGAVAHQAVLYTQLGALQLIHSNRTARLDRIADQFRELAHLVPLLGRRIVQMLLVQVTSAKGNAGTYRDAGNDLRLVRGKEFC